MTIRKGAEWGERRAVPVDVRIAPGDGALHEWVCAHRRKGIPIGDVAVGGGDLARTLGGGTRPGTEAAYVPLDVVHVVADGEHTTWSAVHVVARRSWWHGELVLAMTAEFLGGYDVAPRSHPNDGLLDVLRVDPAMPWRARLQARRRAGTGAHLPHPQISVSRSPSIALSFQRPLVVWVDGVRWRSATRLELTVESDAYHAYV